MCGLKLLIIQVLLKVLVTPHVGVWIETASAQRDRLEAAVTPHVGVWIETFNHLLN